MALISHPEHFQAKHAEPAFASATAFRRTVWRWAHDESGATAVEYGLLAASIGLGILAAITGLKDKLSGVFNTLGSAISGT